MRIILCITAFILVLGSAAVAQTSPQAAAHAFYKAYQQNEADSGQRELFIANQKGLLEPSLYNMLVEAAGRQSTDKFWLDFDPFVNAQMNAASMHLGSASVYKGVATIPLFCSYRIKGKESLALTVQLRQVPGGWKIVNFLYPASGSEKPWDLKSFLTRGLKKK